MVNRSPVALRLLLAVCAWAYAMPGFAQTSSQPHEPEPAHIAYIDGTVSIAREGRAEDATINLPLVAGDALRTRDGRVEVIFGDGSVLDIDHFTSIDFLSDELLRLLEGRVRLTIGGRDRVSYRVDTPSGSVQIDEPGEYRIALIGESRGPLDVELITIRGFATLINDLGRTEVAAGERAFASASMAPSYAQEFNSATWDAFDRWAADRREERTGTASAQYLPEEVRGYSSSFDRYGDWRYDVTYGYVWYPRVHVDWRPYYYGRWRHYNPWGWTWIAYDPWGWPTHHYGRWGFSAGVWFWIPSRRWGPAHVYWASAPGYVGWCPLGWNGRPVFNIINVNIGRRGYRHGYDPYRAWTVVPRHAFAARGNVREHAVPRNRLERAVPRWSVAGAAAPVRAAAAASRDVTPIYSAGRAARLAERGRSVSPGGAERSAPFRRTEGRSDALGGERAVRRSPSTERGDAVMPRRSDALAPRTTAPAAPGVLGPADDARAGVTRSRARSRDLGPGGPDTTAPVRSESPRGRVSDRDRGRNERTGAYAPRGVPDGGPGYAPRGVPRSGPSDYTRGERSIRRNPESVRPSSPGQAPSGGDRPTYSRPPSYSRPSAPSSRPSDGGRPAYSPPRGGDRPVYSPPRGGDRPTYSRPAPSNRGGGDRPSRAVPRGSSGQSSQGGGGHSRRRPQ